MAGIPDEIVKEVRERVDIVDLIGRYVDLRRAGQNWKGLCPFHDERTPSFNVNPTRKGFKCFGCGAGGDALRFVMDVEGVSFPEAVRRLAELSGVRLPAFAEGRGRGPAEVDERADAYAIVRLATEHYRETLLRRPEGEAGRRYCSTRALSAEVAETFRVGYAPAPSEGGWDGLCRAIAAAKLSLELAERLGLVGRSERTSAHYDRFRGRLMFPIIKPGGEVVGFSGRIVPPHDEEADGNAPPKYLNSPESLLFSKGKMLFGLHAARPHVREKQRILLVEGNMDVVTLHQRGFGEAVAPLGTAITPEQVRLVARFARAVVLCFDGDTAGKKAAAAALPLLLDQDLDPRLVLLDPGEDPDSTPIDRFTALVDQARPALETMMVKLAGKAGTAIDARARALDQMLPLLAKVQSETARYFYAERAASLFHFPMERVIAALRGPPRGPSQARPTESALSSTSSRPVSVSAPMRPLPPLPASQANVTALLVDVPHLAAWAEEANVREHVSDARLRPIVDAVLAAAKRGEQPGMSELLDMLEPAAQRQVHDAVFAGRYRGLDGGPDLELEPRAELDALLALCREQELEARIHDLDGRTLVARERGDLELVRTLSQEKLELRRKQEELVRRRQAAGRGFNPVQESPTASN